MSRVIATRNVIRIPDPAFLHLVTWMITGLCVAGLLGLRQASIQRALDFFQRLPDREQSIQLTAEVVRGQLLPHGLCLALTLFAAVYSLRACVGGAWTMLGWLRRLGGEVHANVPAGLDGGSSVAERLFQHHSLTQDREQVPPWTIRLLFGNTSWWLSPSAAGLISHLDTAVRRLLCLAVVLLVPTFLPAGWLQGLLERAEPDAAVLRILSVVESVLHWPLQWYFLLVAGGILVGLYLAVMLVRGQPVQVEHEELQADLPELPHPDEVFSIIRRELNELRYREFPNRGVGSDRSPGLKTVRRGEVGSFECSRTIETQPVPIGSGRSIPSLFLLLMGSLLLLAGFWLLLRQPGLPDQPFVLAAWLPGLLTGMTAIRGGRRMVQSAWELAHTFRFRSELIRVSGSGTYRVGSVAVNSGYLGGANADQSEVLSRMYVTIHATQLTTEVCAPTQSWRPIAVAMATPRTIVSAAKSTEFSQRLEALLETLREARPTSSLPGLNPNSHGARQMLEINQQVALQHQRLGQHLGHQLVQPPIPGSEWMPGVQRLPQSDSSAGASP